MLQPKTETIEEMIAEFREKFVDSDTRWRRLSMAGELKVEPKDVIGLIRLAWSGGIMHAASEISNLEGEIVNKKVAVLHLIEESQKILREI